MNSNLPYSEQWRLAALEAVDTNSAASMLEELKGAFLAQKIAEQGDMPHAHAERIVKSSPEWKDYIVKMVKARKLAGQKKVEAEFLNMKAWEQRSEEANRRAEMKL